MYGKNQKGLLLIELMIGLFIGLLTTLAITNVLSLAEGQRRAAISGSDAQVSGSVSLNAIQRDLRQAGYGLSTSPDALGCTISGSYNGNPFSKPLAPIVIADGAGGAPDSLSILSSNRRGAAVPVLVDENHVAGATPLVVKGAFSVAVDDYLVAVHTALVVGSNPPKYERDVTTTPTPPCELFKVTVVTAAPPWGVSTDPAAGDFIAKSYLLNLGNTLRLKTYSISAQNVLQMTEQGAAAQDIAPEIVNLQAFYGKDTNGDNVIDAYDTTTPTTAAGWQQVIAIRVALVARSVEYEKEEVTANLPEWDIGSTIAVSGTVGCASGSGGQCIRIKVDSLANWKHYRYKVYDTLIPLRNMLWNS